MKRLPNKVIISVLFIMGSLVLCFLLFFIEKKSFVMEQKEMSPVESLINDYTQDKEDVKLTIGVLKGDQTSYKVYGMNSKVIDPIPYEYEIGSISKTMTTSMLCKAVGEEKIVLEDAISKYLELESNTYFPTVLSLATHTSGYADYPFDNSSYSQEELEAITKSFYEERKNIYQGMNSAFILNKIESHILEDKGYEWEYSNFGFAVLGTVISEVYHRPFKPLMDEFIQKDLKLKNTRVGDGTGNLNSYWTWNQDDASIAAGGLVTTVTDLLKYGEMHLEEEPSYLALSHEIYENIDENNAVGLGWMIDTETGYLWHNGGTSNCTSFLGIDKEHHTVVVILSNYSAKEGTEDEEALDILGYLLLEDLSAK